MWERFKPRSPKGRSNRWWLMGAIATPVCLGMLWWLWLLPHRSLQPDESYRSHNESAPLVHPHREASIINLGTIAAVAAGVFLLLKFRRAKSSAETLNLSGADFCGADLHSADFCGADLSGANLNGANLSDANLSGALLFFINSRAALNLEPFQLKAQPSPFLCNVALPAYAQQPRVNPNRDCDRIPQLLSTRYDISLEEAQGIVDEARQHHWD
ncbi:MAG: pentapeptide repeat-containing protein [Leptolyngbyaceae cyanobacterium]